MKTLKNLFKLFCIFLAIWQVSMPCNAEATIYKHNQTASGLTGTIFRNDHIEVQLNPLKQDQVVAFFLGRGFSQQVADQISKQCVHQTVIKNISSNEQQSEVAIDLSNWDIIEAEVERKLIPTLKWLTTWEEQGASESARLAFSWATFPSKQVFAVPGDYGWGMTLFGEISEPSFDVTLRWRQNGEIKEQLIQALNCPKITD